MGPTPRIIHLENELRLSPATTFGPVCHNASLGHLKTRAEVSRGFPKLMFPSCAETRYQSQRHYNGAKQQPFTVPWIIQQLQEDPLVSSIAKLMIWTNQTRCNEITESLIEEINQMSTEDAHEVVMELKQPRQVQGTRGSKLQLCIILSTEDGRNFEQLALLDSGSTTLNINESFVEENNIPTRKLAQPIPVYNTDGTLNTNRAITRVVDCRMTVQDHTEQITLFVTNLGTTSVYIGHTWLKKHNPTIDWTNARITFNQCYSCKFITNLSEIETMNEKEERINSEFEGTPEEPLEEGDMLYMIDMDDYIETNGIEISLLNPTTSTSKGTRYDYILKYNPDIAQKKTFNEVVPEEYHSYKDVFEEKEFDKLPQRRPWDHTIELDKNFKPVRAKNYNLSSNEQEVLQEFLEENLRTGRIRPSKSPMAPPFFFIKKKEGALRPTQDYRKLNAETIKNRYPLPLISELIDRVQDAKVFSKMDIRWGYNNIRIKEGDEWKAAFTTNKGLFKPTVMFFGLTNSPATFQNFMDHIFADLIIQGVVTVYMDDILVHTRTQQEHVRAVHEVLRIL